MTDARKIRHLMIDRDMNQKALAEASGLTEHHVSQIMSGRIENIQEKTLWKLCGALECKPEDIR